jgi:hypothetical protein
MLKIHYIGIIIRKGLGLQSIVFFLYIDVIDMIIES